MLHIYRSPSEQLLDTLSRIQLSLPRPLQFAPIRADGDELTEDLLSDPMVHDNVWQLNERPDPVALEAFWSSVSTDLSQES